MTAAGPPPVVGFLATTSCRSSQGVQILRKGGRIGTPGFKSLRTEALHIKIIWEDKGFKKILMPGPHPRSIEPECLETGHQQLFLEVSLMCGHVKSLYLRGFLFCLIIATIRAKIIVEDEEARTMIIKT